MTNTTNDAGPEQNHTQQCLDMGWWILHELDPGTPCGERSDPDDPTALALPVIGDELQLRDGTTARVLQRYDNLTARTLFEMPQAWQVTGPDGARVIGLQDIAQIGADEPPTPDAVPDLSHTAALVLNAAISWEQANQRLESDGRAPASADMHRATHQLRAALQAYMPLVAK